MTTKPIDSNWTFPYQPRLALNLAASGVIYCRAFGKGSKKYLRCMILDLDLKILLLTIPHPPVTARISVGQSADTVSGIMIKNSYYFRSHLQE